MNATTVMNELMRKLGAVLVRQLELFTVRSW